MPSNSKDCLENRDRIFSEEHYSYSREKNQNKLTAMPKFFIKTMGLCCKDATNHEHLPWPNILATYLQINISGLYIVSHVSPSNKFSIEATSFLISMIICT